MQDSNVSLIVFRGQSYAAYTTNAGWFMAGGYDGTQEYYQTDLNTTLRLVNDESFVYGGVVRMNSLKHNLVIKDLLIYFLNSFHSHQSHTAW